MYQDWYQANEGTPYEDDYWQRCDRYIKRTDGSWNKEGEDLAAWS